MLDFRIAVRTTVLLVDHDALQVDTCALTLEMNGLSVISATSPDDAISIVNEKTQRKIDVAILDYHMPLMTDAFSRIILKPDTGAQDRALFRLSRYRRTGDEQH